MTGSHNLLRVEVSSKSYVGKEGEHRVLKNATFNVAEREIVCLYGPSGCGKSTLLRIIAGLDADYDGRVVLAGENILEPTSSIGMTVQMHVCYDWLSVAQNIAFGLRYSAEPKGFSLFRVARRAVRKAEAIEQSRTLAELVGLSSRDLNKNPEELSGGMKQRMAFARALMTNPKVLLLDEPFSSLDYDSRESLQDVVLRVRRDLGTAFVCVSHDPEEVLYLGDRVLRLGGEPSTVIEEIIPPFGLDRPADIRYSSAFQNAKKELRSKLERTSTSLSSTQVPKDKPEAISMDQYGTTATQII